MFATALLLGSLILFNGRGPEAAKLAVQAPAMELMELQAELCSIHSNVSPRISYRLHPGIPGWSFSDKHHQPADLYPGANQVRIKKQIQIHLGLKPLISKQSGLNIHHRTHCDDPPVS